MRAPSTPSKNKRAQSLPKTPLARSPTQQEAPPALFQMNELRLSLLLYGKELPSMDKKIVKNIKDSPEEDLTAGTIIGKKYKIKKSIGRRTYEVTNSSNTYILQLENSSRTYDGPNLNRHSYVYKNIKDRLKNSMIHQQHFLQVIASNVTHDLYQFLVVERAGCNVRDLMSSVLQDRPLSRASALNISAQMLQGIHDFHLAGFIHRDIRPHNFFVGFGKNYQRIYIAGFAVCYDRLKDRRTGGAAEQAGMLSPKRLPKISRVTVRFQSRAYHAGDNLCRSDDIESWIYTCIYLFSPDLLPWKDAEDERRGYTSKCRLANGDYNLGELETLFRPMLNSIRYRTLTDERVDFPYYADILESMAKTWQLTGEEVLDWKVNADGIVIARNTSNA